LDHGEQEDSNLAPKAGRRDYVKRSKFTEAQIAFILRQAEEGTSVAEVCRKAGISQATYFNWKKK
jgi:transposase-like protein